jgi:hypothetical protein
MQNPKPQPASLSRLSLLLLITTALSACYELEEVRAYYTQNAEKHWSVQADFINTFKDIERTGTNQVGPASTLKFICPTNTTALATDPTEKEEVLINNVMFEYTQQEAWKVDTPKTVYYVPSETKQNELDKLWQDCPFNLRIEMIYKDLHETKEPGKGKVFSEDNALMCSLATKVEQCEANEKALIALEDAHENGHENPWDIGDAQQWLSMLYKSLSCSIQGNHDLIPGTSHDSPASEEVCGEMLKSKYKKTLLAKKLEIMLEDQLPMSPEDFEDALEELKVHLGDLCQSPQDASLEESCPGSGELGADEPAP